MFIKEVLNFKNDTYQAYMRGELPLSRVLWFYGLIIPFVLSCCAWAVTTFLVGAVFGAEMAFYFDRIINLFILIPYMVLFGCSLYMTAMRYEGFALWKYLNMLAAFLILFMCVLFGFAEYELFNTDYADIERMQEEWKAFLER